MTIAAEYLITNGANGFYETVMLRLQASESEKIATKVFESVFLIQ